MDINNKIIFKYISNDILKCLVNTIYHLLSVGRNATGHEHISCEYQAQRYLCNVLAHELKIYIVAMPGLGITNKILTTK